MLAPELTNALLLGSYVLALVLLVIYGTRVPKGLAWFLAALLTSVFIGLLAIHGSVVARWLAQTLWPWLENSVWPWLTANRLSVAVVSALMIVLLRLKDMQDFAYFGAGMILLAAGGLIVGHGVPDSLAGLQQVFKGVEFSLENLFGFLVMLAGLGFALLATFSQDQRADWVGRTKSQIIWLGMLALIGLWMWQGVMVPAGAREPADAGLMILKGQCGLTAKYGRLAREFDFALKPGKVTLGRSLAGQTVRICADGQGWPFSQAGPIGPAGYQGELKPLPIGYEWPAAKCLPFSLVAFDGEQAFCVGYGRQIEVRGTLRLEVNDPPRLRSLNRGSWHVKIIVRGP